MKTRYAQTVVRASFILTLAFLFIVPEVSGQYFGRNKPSYRRFDFQVFQSPNFEVYHYFNNDSVTLSIAQSLEKWYVRQKLFFGDTFDVRSPVLIYGNHPEFQQTRTIGGTISIGTQAFAEALRNRIVMLS